PSNTWSHVLPQTWSHLSCRSRARSHCRRPPRWAAFRRMSTKAIKQGISRSMSKTPSNKLSTLSCDIIVVTRPAAIKLAPAIKAVGEEPSDFVGRVVSSGQHGEICRSALAAFGLTADRALDIEPIGSSLAESTGALLRAFGRHIAETRPDLIVVQGDTTTAMA